MLDPENYFPQDQSVGQHLGWNTISPVAKPERLDGGCRLYRFPPNSSEWHRDPPSQSTRRAEASWARWTGRALEAQRRATKIKQFDRLRAALGPDGPKTDKALVKLATRIRREYVANDYQPRTELNTAAQRVAEANMLRMREQPAGPNERTFMRGAGRRAVENMREFGYDATPADLQAIVWYPEKELHGYMNIGKGRPDVNDYHAAALRLFKELRDVENI